jgi:hypothetical protein
MRWIVRQTDIWLAFMADHKTVEQIVAPRNHLL